jgi:peptidyl-prolyl cis-trans isomerase C
MTLQPARLLIALLATAALPVMAQNLATVNGKAIPAARAEEIVKAQAAQGQPDSPQMRAQIKEGLVMNEVMLQEAQKQGYDKKDDVKKAIENARQTILVRAMVIDQLRKNPITDAEIKAEYDRFKAATGDTEYHARHILVEKEDDAKAIIAKLNAGAKFEELAKQSKDPGSAANGGDLDWAPPNGYVKPFADAMVALKKGQTTATPVKTDYGYHVIRLDDTRPAKLPSMEEAKQQIVEQLQQRRVAAFQAELRKKAVVK